MQQLTSVCEAHLAGLYVLEVIDIYQNRLAARDDDILAVPTLLKIDPDFNRRLIGDLSDVKKLKLFLGIAASSERLL